MALRNLGTPGADVSPSCGTLPTEPRLPSVRIHSLRNRNQKHSARAVRLLSHIPRLDQIKLAPVEPIVASESGAKFKLDTLSARGGAPSADLSRAGGNVPLSATFVIPRHRQQKTKEQKASSVNSHRLARS